MASGTLKAPMTQESFYRKVYEVFSSGTTIAAGATASKTIDISLLGYTPLALAGLSGSNNTGVLPMEWTIGASTLNVYWYNASGSSKSPSKLTATVLYVKNT